MDREFTRDAHRARILRHRGDVDGNDGAVQLELAASRVERHLRRDGFEARAHRQSRVRVPRASRFVGETGGRDGVERTHSSKRVSGEGNEEARAKIVFAAGGASPEARGV